MKTAITALILLLVAISVAAAVPPLPAEFYGDVSIDGASAPAGTAITAQINGEARGTITTTELGKYGGAETFEPRLVVEGQEDEIGQTISFFINGTEAEQTATFQPGESQRLDLSVILPTPSPTPTPTPTPTPGPGGKSGGGGGPTLIEAVGMADLLTTTDGMVLRSISLTSSDAIAAFTISQGITALDANGNALASVSIERVDPVELPAIPDGALYSFAGYAYRCTPAGASFEPPITLSFTIPEDAWNQLASEQLNIKWYNPKIGSWEAQPTTVNADARRVSVQISHFSIFALFTELPQATPTPAITPTPTAAATASPTPEAPPVTGGGLWKLMIIPLVIVAVVGAFIYLALRQRGRPPRTEWE